MIEQNTPDMNSGNPNEAAELREQRQRRQRLVWVGPLMTLIAVLFYLGVFSQPPAFLALQGTEYAILLTLLTCLLYLGANLYTIRLRRENERRVESGRRQSPRLQKRIRFLESRMFSLLLVLLLFAGIIQVKKPQVLLPEAAAARGIRFPIAAAAGEGTVERWSTLMGPEQWIHRFTSEDGEEKYLLQQVYRMYSDGAAAGLEKAMIHMTRKQAEKGEPLSYEHEFGPVPSEGSVIYAESFYTPGGALQTNVLARRGHILYTLNIWGRSAMKKYCPRSKRICRKSHRWHRNKQEVLMLIKNGTIYTMAGEEPLTNTDLRIEDGRIAKIAPNLKARKDEKVLDARGTWVLPGFIESHCHIGLEEYGAGQEGEDGNEASGPLTPEADALDGVYPADASFTHALRAGVTTVFTGPGSANVVGGLFVALRTWGKTADRMQIPGVRAMKCAFGENPKRVYGRDRKRPVTRMETAAILREILQNAKNYLLRKEEAVKKGEPFEMKRDLEQMLPVIRCEIPLKAHAHRADDILTAVRIAREFHVRLTLDHCTEGHLIADELCAVPYPALCGPTFTHASKPELRHKGFESVVELTKAGKICSVITDHPVIPIEMLPVCAGYAYKEGLSLMEALRTITLNPAKILGIDADYGSLEEGKIANITIYSDNPLSNLSRCLCTIGEGTVLWQDEKALLPPPVRKL